MTATLQTPARKPGMFSIWLQAIRPATPCRSGTGGVGGGCCSGRRPLPRCAVWRPWSVLCSFKSVPTWRTTTSILRKCRCQNAWVRFASPRGWITTGRSSRHHHHLCAGLCHGCLSDDSWRYSHFNTGNCQHHLWCAACRGQHRWPVGLGDIFVCSSDRWRCAAYYVQCPTVMERVLDISSCRASNDRDFGRQIFGIAILTRWQEENLGGSFGDSFRGGISSWWASLAGSLVMVALGTGP